MYKLLQHPDRFVWDFWYHYDSNAKIFHVFYLNAPSALAPANQHHFSSVVGYAITKDFSSMEWIDNNVFHASSKSWDNTSIWSGDVIQCKDGYLLYYTSRNAKVDDGMTQNIGLAFSTDFRKWERVNEFRLEPDGCYYEPRFAEGDNSIHAWRDPYLFRYHDDIYMLVAAKNINHKVGRKGTIGLLRSIDNSLIQWEVLPPLYSSGWVSECDVPLIYQREEHLILAYTCWAKYDFTPSTQNKGGLHLVAGKGMSLAAENFTNLPSVIMPEESGYYACRVIPELNGDIVCPNFKKGGIRRISLYTGLQHVNRDFSDIRF